MSIPHGVIMQYFQWYTAADSQLWNELTGRAPELAQTGFTAIWLPPFSKGSGGVNDVGYGCYDLFDLGEFNQKHTIPTKYGTKDELLNAIRTAHANGIQCYADVVFNHKDGADETEVCWAQEVNWDDRNEVSSDWYQITAYTRFTFEGRANKYSSMQWYWWCFDALTFNVDTERNDILYRLKDKHFSTEVSHEHGNYEYLMADDLDTTNEFVYGELMYWGEWVLDTTGVDGFRIDAAKHIRYSFFTEWLNYLRTQFTGKELFSVGEYWSPDIAELHDYISNTDGVMSLFDVPLHYHFQTAGLSGNAFDMRTILQGTLMNEQPTKAVTFVENHDTQPCQSLESPVEPWFKPLAYAIILLRAEGYPCVFYADYYGATYTDCRGAEKITLYSHRFLIDKFMSARNAYGFGDQQDYFDHPNTIGWVRLGNSDHPGAMAVVLTNGSDGFKWMNVYRPGKVFYDCTEHIAEKVITNGDGWGQFKCLAGSVSVWLQE